MISNANIVKRTDYIQRWKKATAKPRVIYELFVDVKDTGKRKKRNVLAARFTSRKRAEWFADQIVNNPTAFPYHWADKTSRYWHVGDTELAFHDGGMITWRLDEGISGATSFRDMP